MMEALHRTLESTVYVACMRDEDSLFRNKAKIKIWFPCFLESNYIQAEKLTDKELIIYARRKCSYHAIRL